MDQNTSLGIIATSVSIIDIEFPIVVVHVTLVSTAKIFLLDQF